MDFCIFVVDDDRHYARLLGYRLEKNGRYDVRMFSCGEDALRGLDQNPDLVLLDMMMPGIGGMRTLEEIRRLRPEVPVVIVSAQGTIERAVNAIKMGAYDYITKGQDDLVKMEVVVGNVLEKVAMERELESLRTEVADRYGMGELIGESQPMRAVYRLIRKALRGDLTVAVHGESGTGKELVARAIHYNSTRRQGPFVVVNCAAIPRDLMESEFFGHEKGAFTGAHKRKTGRFEQADGGTLFLDEIGELDLDLQAKLLRALQNREIQRVGGAKTITFDARVISATNRNMASMVREGTFREDLYYRLFQFPIPLPPLRERGQDVLLLARHFLETYAEAHDEIEGKELSAEAHRAILEHPWPGNVRELKSAVERALLIADDALIQPGDLMLNGGVGLPAERLAEPGGDGAASGATHGAPFGDASGADDADILTIEELKRNAVERAYRLCEGNVDKAAVELDIGRATMYRLLKKYGIKD